MSSIKSSISLLLSGNLFVSLFAIIVSYAICNSSFPSKVNKFIVNYRLFHKFMFEYNKDKDDEDTRRLNELFEKLLAKVNELLEKKHGKQIMDAGWCDLDETNIMTSRRSRSELNYSEEDVELEYEELEYDAEDELEEDDITEELEEDNITEELEEENELDKSYINVTMPIL